MPELPSCLFPDAFPDASLLGDAALPFDAGEARTRVIHLGQPRDGALNGRTRTVCVALPELAALAGLSTPGAAFETHFVRHYQAIRRTCEGFGRRGVAVLAVHPLRGLTGTLRLSARSVRPTSAIVGRHGSADLYLEADR
jgi:hypothetical protein